MFNARAMHLDWSTRYALGFDQEGSFPMISLDEIKGDV